MTPFMVGLFGFAIALYAFLSVLRWVAMIYTIVTDPTRAGRRGKGGRVALATLLGSGFWVLVILCGVAYGARAEQWAPAFFIGAGAGIAFQMLPVCILLWQRRWGR